jgi:hypothetical protein
MTFLSQQKFNEDGVIKIISKRRRVLEDGKVEDGVLKGKARIVLEYGDLDRTMLVDVGDLEAAETFVLTEFEVFYGMSTPPLNQIDPENHFAHRISIAAASIGDSTKRAWGNTVVCHPERRAQVDDCWNKIKAIKIYSEEIADMIDGERPYFDEPLKVYESENAPKDKVLVMYIGDDENDQPLIHVDGEGLLMNNTLVNVKEYGRFVRIP